MLLTAGGVVQQVVDVRRGRATCTAAGTGIVQTERLKPGTRCRRNDHSYGRVVRFSLFGTTALTQQIAANDRPHRDVTAVVLKSKVINFVTRSFPWCAVVSRLQ